ncbi:MAG: RES family NAD+ phosphorylase [candidate division Zixibacteria bacterium]|nr:RES family NAD+ phosphorylase [candidate division Zixibacteria bacterium]
MENLKISDGWYHFGKLNDIIKYESRFIIQEPYKSFVDSIVVMVREQFMSVITASTKLYRARINKFNFEKREHEKIPFPSDEMGHPPQHLAVSGRINPEGIPYFYCAGELDTAAAELRPWKGAYLTIGEVDIKRDIAIADLTLECKEDEWSMFFNDFAEMFSIQWPPELKLNYLVTQYFSEHFKAVGLRGIKYKSEFNIGGNNYALFYKKDYDINKTYSVETSEISYFFYENQNV